MQAQRFDGELEFIFVDGRSERRHAWRSCAELAAERPARSGSSTTHARTTPVALNIGLAAARGRVIARMDAHTHYPPDYLARGVERLRRGGAAHVSGPQIPRARAAGRAGWRWRSRAAWAPAGPTSATCPTARSRWTAASPASGCAPPSSATAAGTRTGPTTRTPSWRRASAPSGGRIVCLPEMAAEYVPRDSLGSARAPVLPLRPVPLQDLGAPPREHAPLPRARAGARGHAGRGRPARCAARWRSRLAPAWALRRRRARRSSAGEATPGGARGRRLPAAGVRDHAPGLGARLPRRVRALRPAAARRSGGSPRAGERRCASRSTATTGTAATATGCTPTARSSCSSAGWRATSIGWCWPVSCGPDLPARPLPRPGRDRVRAPAHLPEPRPRRPRSPAMARSLRAFWRLLDARRRRVAAGPAPALHRLRPDGHGARASGWPSGCARTSPSTCAAGTPAGAPRTWPATCSRAPTACWRGAAPRSWWARSWPATTAVRAGCSRSPCRWCARRDLVPADTTRARPRPRRSPR